MFVPTCWSVETFVTYLFHFSGKNNGFVLVAKRKKNDVADWNSARMKIMEDVYKHTTPETDKNLDNMLSKIIKKIKN